MYWGCFFLFYYTQTIERLTGFVQKCKLFHNNSEVSVIDLQH